MRISRFDRSLTVRLALLYAVSTVLILSATAFYLLRVIEQHFVEQDLVEMRGKLELASRLLAKAQAEQLLEFLPYQLDDALIGHRHLALAVFANGKKIYAYGAVAYPDELLTQAGTRTWQDDRSEYRGLALHIPAGEGFPQYTVAVAVDTAHHREFVDHFKLALSVVFGLATLSASALGWGVARMGLAPLQQTARLAGKISAERLDMRLPGDRVPLELDDLALSFNAMLDRLRDSIDRLSSFAADLAHEMRTPVNNLMMQTQVMLSQTRSVEEYREVLASNLEEYERLARMIGDMLFLAKADNGLIVPTREEIDLAREVAEIFDFYEALAEDKAVKLLVEGAARVSGDRLMLRRALSNLISNAIRYTPFGSDVHVRLCSANQEVRITIDNPCVVVPESPEKLFDRFYRADPARRETGDGTGLGLAITQSIARAHGGEVAVTARSTGICFEVKLPAH